MSAPTNLRGLLLERFSNRTHKLRRLRAARLFTFESLETRIQFAADFLAELATSPEVCPPDMFVATTSDLLPNDQDFAAAALADTFTLHSLPGASKVIYLDFDGHTTEDTPWNDRFTENEPFDTPAYSIDAESAFSDAELTRIQAIWARVKEDFLPFNVDVTTEDPGVDALSKANSFDTVYGVRVVIGGSASDWYTGGAGGVAWLNSFDDNVDNPVFVFTDNLANGSEKSTAEAASHEVGHALGLDHKGTDELEYYGGHGTGDTAWGPIMGVGYGVNLTQWSRGEYPDSNNHQNDLVIIVQPANGFTYRPDDHANDRATATPLTVEGLDVSATGIIERTTDRDYFSFTTAAGLVSFEINPAEKGPNLDIFAAIYSSSGSLIMRESPDDSLSVTLSATLPAGNYFLVVDGTGRPASESDESDYGYSEYASLGFFSITGQVAAVPVDADFNADEVVDGQDFLMWQRGVGKLNALRTDGDSNSDGDVDGDDFAAWTEQFGPAPQGAALAIQSSLPASALLPHNAWLEHVNQFESHATGKTPVERAPFLQLQTDDSVQNLLAAAPDREIGELQIREQLHDASLGDDELQHVDAALATWFPTTVTTSLN